MKNLLIDKLNEKDIFDFTSNAGLYIRRKMNDKYKSLSIFLNNNNIIRLHKGQGKSNNEYFRSYSTEYVEPSLYPLDSKKNNIIVERYPELDENESYIFIGNHSCPEDIDTMINVLDRNAYVVSSSIESLNYDPKSYLLWLNGLIPYNPLNQNEKYNLITKMERVLNTNSILMFPEEYYNLSPNKIVNNINDDPVRLSLSTNKKVVIVSMVRDEKNNVSYLDVSNPINISKMYSLIEEDLSQKDKIHMLNKYLRDKMATALYCLTSKHLDVINRADNNSIEDKLREEKINNIVNKMHIDPNTCESDFGTIKTDEEKEYEDVIETMSNLRLNLSTLRQTLINTRAFVNNKEAISKNNNVENIITEYKNKTK